MSISEFTPARSSDHHTLRHVNDGRDPIQYPGRHIQRARTTDSTESRDPFPYERRIGAPVFAPHTFNGPLAHSPPTIDGIVEIRQPPTDSIGFSLMEWRAPPPRRIMTRTFRTRQRRDECIQECGPVGIGRWGERSEPVEYKPQGRSPDPWLHNSHSIEHPRRRPPYGNPGRCRTP